MKRMMPRSFAWVIVVVLAVVGGNRAVADDAAGGDGPKVKVDAKELLTDPHAKHAPATAPATTKAATKPVAEVRMSAEARAELGRVTKAYQKINSIEVAGTLAADLSAGDEHHQYQETFSGSFVAPNKFRHEMRGDMIVGSTGEKIYAYRPQRNDYKTADAPDDRVPAEKYPSTMREILQMQNVGLMCALVDDAGKFLADGMKEVARAGDENVDGKACVVLAFTGDKMDYRVLLDAQTHLVRRAVLDLKRTIEASGRDDVKFAWLTFDYTAVRPGAKGEDKLFAWSPPQGAKDVATAESEEEEALAMVGKDAPDFILKGLDGKPVSMAEQKGSVIVLDFWATWCGPCQESLPELNKLYKEMRDKGLKAFAIDLEEDKDTVRPVAAKLIPDLPVLLDERGEAARAYGVGPIPTTVVVGKNGKILKVFIGSGNEGNIRAAVEKGLTE